MTFELDIPAVRACASALSDTGAQVVAGATGAPPAPTVPRWAASDALVSLIETARLALGALGEGVGSAGRGIIAAVEDYQDADDRAAHRLRSGLWH